MPPRVSEESQQQNLQNAQDPNQESLSTARLLVQVRDCTAPSIPADTPPRSQCTMTQTKTPSELPLQSSAYQSPTIIRRVKTWQEIEDRQGRRIFRCATCHKQFPTARRAGHHHACQTALQNHTTPNNTAAATPSGALPNATTKTGKGWQKVTDPNGGPSFFRCLLCSERRDNAVAAGQHARRCRERQLSRKRPSQSSHPV